MLEALLSEKIKWKKDPDFGYEIVDVDAPENAKLVEKVPAEILDPRASTTAADGTRTTSSGSAT